MCKSFIKSLVQLLVAITLQLPSYYHWDEIYNKHINDVHCL